MQSEQHRLISTVKNKLNEDIHTVVLYSDDELKILIHKYVLLALQDPFVSSAYIVRIINTIFNSMRKFDILQDLIEDDAINEIMVNGHTSIFIEKHHVLHKTPLTFDSSETLYNIIQTMVSGINRSVNESEPIVDARLKDGSRIHVVLPPIALNGPILTIRKFPRKPLTMTDIIQKGSLTEEAAAFLNENVRNKKNIFISGGTASGKTTFLNILSSFIPKEERIVTIEDSAELNLHGAQNIVRLEARNNNSEGRGEISIRDLIKAALRMRPDRIVVGEVRGAEAIDMLQAMNTGHSGSISTGHANSSRDMLSRLETMVLLGANIPLLAISRQIASAIDILVHLCRTKDMQRHVQEISSVDGINKDGQIILTSIFLQNDETKTLERIKSRARESEIQ